MARFKIATTFLPFTVSLPAGGTEQAASPASNLMLYQYPHRTWRSTTLGAERVVLDLGAALVIKAVLQIHTNYTSSTIRIADNAAITTNVVNLGAATILRDRRVNHYQEWRDLESNALSRRYVEVIPGSVLAGETYYELGSIAVFSAVTTMAQNPGFPRWVREEPTTRLPFEGGGEDVNRNGPGFLVYDFGQATWKTLNGARATLQDILDVGTAGYFALWENAGDASQAYVFRRLGAMPFTESFAMFEMSTTVWEPS